MQSNQSKNRFTQFCPIAPVELLIELRKLGLVESHIVVLAHDVVAHPNAYQRLLTTAIADDASMEPWTVILDNSQAEVAKGEVVFDEPLGEVIAEAACILFDAFPSAEDLLTICLPDTIGNWEKTVEDSARASIDWAQILRKRRMLLGRDYKWAAVMQGVHHDEQDKCIEGLSCIPDIRFWCVPRNLTNQGMSRNIAVLNMINKHAILAYKIHLFGMSNNIHDDITATQFGVVGIDSANPLVSAHLGERLIRPMNVKHQPRGDFWEKAQFTDLMGDNICMIRDAIRDGVW